MDTKQKRIFEAIAVHIPKFIIDEYVVAPYSPGVHGQFRYGTLMFADISGFTAMSEKLSERGKEGAEELTDILNQYFTKMLNIAVSYQGCQLKFGGDAMLILFLGHRHAARAVRCALKVQEANKHFHQLSTSHWESQLLMSIGINTGEFFKASLGSPKERLYCLFTGKEINRIAEIEAVANAGEIFIGPGTLHELKDKIEVGQERTGYYEVKNLSARVRRMAPYSLYLEEKVPERVIDILTSYLPKLLAKRIKANPWQAGIDGQHRRVTIMFVNLLGSNKLIEEYGREGEAQITQILNDCFLKIHETANKYGGVLLGCDIHIEGDKLLIIFGAPVAHEDDEERAVHCALEMKQQITESGLPFRQRIGINTGYVYSGEVGSTSRKEYTVMGDQVNLAARLMAVAQEGQIIIGHSTYSKVRGKFAVQTRNPVKVKGKNQPVASYQVEGIEEETILYRQPSGGELLGREEEVVVVKEIIERVFSGQGQVLDISGEAGIGKSRLVEELRVLYADHGGSVHIGNCRSYGTGIPYLPWIELLNSIFELQANDSATLRVEKIETAINNLCPELEDWTALVGNLLGAPIQESGLVKSLDPQLRHQRLMNIILELLQAQAEQNPLLLILEDMHWTDATSIEFLNYIARDIERYPLLLCLVHRPGIKLGPEVKELSNYVEIILKALSTESSLDLACSMVNMAELPSELNQLLTIKSQGNPLFVKEVVRSIIDSGYLKLNAATGEYELAGELQSAEVPDTIHGLIMGRLDQLEEETTSVLRVASVIGQVFQYNVLKEIFPHPITDRELRRRLGYLVNLDLARLQTDKPFPEYCFNHVLTQEVAYETLLFAQRRELHHKVGEYFEKQHADNIETYYELLAYHYGRTRDSEKTVDYSVKAGDKAKGMFINQEATRYYKKALEVAEKLDSGSENVKCKVYEDLGDIYELIGEYDLALESYDISKKWYEQIQTRDRRRKKRKTAQLENLASTLPFTKDMCDDIATFYCKKATVYRKKGQYNAAIEWSDKGLMVSNLTKQQRARLNVEKAAILCRKSDYDQALEWCQQGLKLSRAVGDLSEVAHACYLMGTIYNDLGNIYQAIEYRHRSLSIYEEIKDLPGQAKAYNNLGVDYYYMGDWDKAGENYRQSLEIREKIGDISGVATVSNNLGEVLSDQGYLDDSIECFLTCLKTWEKTGYLLGIGLAYSNLGRAYTRRSDCSEALEYLKKSIINFEEVQSQGFLAEAHQRLAETYLVMSQPDNALEHCERSLALAQELKMSVVEGVTRRIMGQAHHSLAEWKEAEELLNESEGILRMLGVPYELGQTQWQLGLLYKDIDKVGYKPHQEGKAWQFFAEAITTFNKLGVKFDPAVIPEQVFTMESGQTEQTLDDKSP